MKKAKWLTDYDMHNDKCYDRPQCPECIAPVYEHKDGTFHCISCGQAVELDESMTEWVRSRSGTKITFEDCPDYEFEFKGKKIKMGCGGTGCVETHYIRNPVTMQWQVAWGECKNCGRGFIV